MASEYENRVAQAILAVENGQSQAAAARDWQLDRSTLNKRIHGQQSREKAHLTAYRLSPEQEAFLVGWIINEEAAGRAPSRVEVVGFADCILNAAGDPHGVGKRWLDRFISRNPTIRTKVGRKLEASRATASDPERIAVFYDFLAKEIAKKHVEPRNIANIDETGVQEGESKAGKVLGSSLRHYTEVIQSESTAWVSIIEAITADGRRLTPVVIYTGETVQAQWFPHTLPPCLFESTPTGWSNKEIFNKWFREVYLKETKVRKGVWRILILDGHSTHVTYQIMLDAYKNNIQLMYIPSHTSHITQPLDMVPFAVLKTAYHRETKHFQSFEASAPIAKQRFLNAYGKASNEAFSSRIIHAGFRRAGCWPVSTADMAKNELIVEPAIRPLTPEIHSATTSEPPTFNTPYKSHDLRSQSKILENNFPGWRIKFGEFIQKTGKALDLQAARIAGLQEDIKRKDLEIESLTPVPRKTVRNKDPNQKFIELKDIWEAQEKAEKLQAKLIAKRKRDIADEKGRLQDEPQESITVATSSSF